MPWPIDITPVEFEIHVRNFLEREGAVQKDFRAKHREVVTSADGDFEIDVTARFEALGADFLVLIECKRFESARIERELVQVPHQKQQSLRAQKAMMFSTSPYRSGAVKFAEVHAIALVVVSQNEFNFAVKSWTDRIGSQIIVPTTGDLDEAAFAERQVLKPLTKTAEAQAWYVRILREHLDYRRIAESRGKTFSGQSIESLKAELEREMRKLEKLLNDEQ